MTPEELNEKCCRFTRIEPKRESHCRCESRSGWPLNQEQRDAECTAKVTIEIYPPVSTDWAAAGRLMDALSAKGILWRVSHLQEKKCKFALVVDPTSNKSAEASHESAPMALALAVAELSRAPGQLLCYQCGQPEAEHLPRSGRQFGCASFKVAEVST